MKISNEAIGFILLHPFTSLTRLTARNNDERVKRFVERYRERLLKELKQYYQLELDEVPFYGGDLSQMIQSAIILGTRSQNNDPVKLDINGNKFYLSSAEIANLRNYRSDMNYNVFHNHIWLVAKQLQVLEPALLTRLPIEYVDRLYLLLDFRRRESNVQILNRIVYDNNFTNTQDESLDDLVDFIKDYYNG